MTKAFIERSYNMVANSRNITKFDLAYSRRSISRSVGRHSCGHASGSQDDDDEREAYWLHANCYIVKISDLDGTFKLLEAIQPFSVYCGKITALRSSRIAGAHA